MARPKKSTPAAPSGEGLHRRVGARRRSEIPPEVLDGLHRGELQTVNLVEWLAIDLAVLLENLLDDLRITKEREFLLTQAKSLAVEGVNRRMEGIARALHQAFGRDRRRHTIFRQLREHPSDVVRCWAATVVTLGPELSLSERLEAIVPLAADPHFGVREAAWMAVRKYVAEELESALELLVPWTEHEDPNRRRFAVELTRPRGVWCAHIPRLREEPEVGLPLLEPVRSDESRYVRLSVANWLNDASKTRADWVEETCARWLLESPTDETRWIVHHAQRTLRKEATKSTSSRQKKTPLNLPSRRGKRPTNRTS